MEFVGLFLKFQIYFALGHCFVFPDGIHYSPKSALDDCGVINEDPTDIRTATPWNAAIFQRDKSSWKYLFSGTVIGPSTILTLGRRFWENIDGHWQLSIPNANDLLVGVGIKSTNLAEKDQYSQLSEVYYLRPHTKFNEKTRIHDVALIHLKKPLNLTTPYVRAACLPKLNNKDPNADLFVPGTLAIHGGFDWHSRKDGYRDMKVSRIKMQTYDHCLQAFRRLEAKTPFYLYCARIARGLVKEDNLCLFYGSTPVILIEGKYIIIGLNSVFTLTGPNYSCDKNSVNWFSRLNGTLDWVIKGMECGPTKWSCGDNKCLNLGKICDQTQDCASDNFDEDPIYCRGLNRCESGKFACGTYGGCVDKSEVCDGKEDCEAGEDEDPEGVCTGKFPVLRKGCSPIPRTEGVRIECEDADSGRRVDCSGSRPVPFGVKAKLTCDKYYISSLNRPTALQTCSASGQWKPAISFGCYPDCGKAEKALNLLIVNGTLTSRDSWPWHAAIFKYNDDYETYSYICGGSVIHRSVVLSAAHCLFGEYNELQDVSKFKIVLAPISSNFAENQKDSQAQIFNVTRFNFPETFNTRNYETDIAVLQLSKPVEFNDYIRPVCYSSSTQEHKAIQTFQLSPSNLGQVIGFGIDETLGVSNKLKFANLPVVSSRDCYNAFMFEPKDFSYCAGYTNGTSACNGDSGGGMVFDSGTGISPRYFIQGIVSHGPKLEHSTLCNSHTYTVFTKVGFFSDWIQQEIYKIEFS